MFSYDESAIPQFLIAASRGPKTNFIWPYNGQTTELAFPPLIKWNALASTYSEFPAPYVVHTRVI